MALSKAALQNKEEPKYLLIKDDGYGSDEVIKDLTKVQAESQIKSWLEDEVEEDHITVYVENQISFTYERRITLKV